MPIAICYQKLSAVLATGTCPRVQPDVQAWQDLAFPITRQVTNRAMLMDDPHSVADEI
jgi:hypothetical protein